jgi:hypothetical protein
MTTTPHTIVDLTRDVLAAAGLPGSPSLHPWRVWPLQEGDVPAVAIVCNGASDAPQSRTMGPAKWTRTATLSLAAVVAPLNDPEDLGSDAVALQEAILDALFADEDWCQQWLGTPSVDAAINQDGTATHSYCPVGIAIRGEYSLSRDYGTPDGVCSEVRYENEAVDGGDYHGRTVP